MKYTEQEPPYAIQIEPTEGCTLACHFCALQSIRDNGANALTETHGAGKGPFKFMELPTARRIACEIARCEWNPRIEFAMHGEPTMNPWFAGLVKIFREELPKASLMVTTNGSGILKPERMLHLFESGINTIAIDNYKHAQFVERMKPWLPDFLQEHEIDFAKYPRDKSASPHARFHGKRVIVIKDISENTDGTHKITNQGGNSLAAVDTVYKRCAKPFRELSIRWDGNVAICCDDWPGEYKIGNVNKMKLDAIWQHPRYRAARKALYHGRRDLIPTCAGCNVVTYRNGLLPDKYGKLTLGKPVTADHELIAEATEGKPFTPRVERT